MKLYKCYILVIFSIWVSCQYIYGKEGRFIITFQFSAYPDECEILWITDNNSTGKDNFTISPIDMSIDNLNFENNESLSDSLKNLLNDYNNLISVNKKNRLFAQIFTKTWIDFFPHRGTDYVNVFICPINGDFKTILSNNESIKKVQCNDVTYNSYLWDTPLGKELKSIDFSWVDYKKYSMFKSHKPKYEPSRAQAISGVNAPLKKIEAGNFWKINFHVESCSSNAGSYSFIIPTDSVSQNSFILTPFISDDYNLKFNGKETPDNVIKMAQVYSKTWVQNGGEFNHVYITVTPIKGKLLHAYYPENDMLYPIYAPVEDYCPQTKLWLSPDKTFFVKYSDYSNFDFLKDFPDNKILFDYFYDYIQ